MPYKISLIHYSRQNSKEGYFDILKINSKEEYYSLINKNINHNNINISNLTDMLYPFYVVESVEKPGFCVNLKVVDNQAQITIEPCYNNSTERFTVRRDVSNEYSTDQCISP